MYKMVLVGLLFLGLSLGVNAQESKENIKKVTEVKQTNNTIVVLETNAGKIELKMFSKASPLAVENFVTHIKNGYYNGLIFHRVIKGFMIQGGDPTGTGRGGESIWHKEFKNENTPNLVFDKPFILAMANHGRNTNGSQFFITTVPTPHLNGGYTIFGEVVSGQDTVQKIENVDVSRGANRPLFDQKIIKAYIKK